MIPYKEASDEIRRQGELPVKAFGTGLGMAAGLTQIMPFLSSYIPEELTIKGISKINKQLGGFVKNALKSGRSLEEVKSFIKEKAESTEKQGARSFSIKENSPLLAEEIQSTISRGYNPLQAAALFSNHSKFKKDIKNIERQSNRKIEDLIAEEFGEEKSGPKSQGNSQERLMMLLQKLSQSRGGK